MGCSELLPCCLAISLSSILDRLLRIQLALFSSSIILRSMIPRLIQDGVCVAFLSPQNIPADVIIKHKWHLQIKDVCDGGVLMVPETSKRSCFKHIEQLRTLESLLTRGEHAYSCIRNVFSLDVYSDYTPNDNVRVANKRITLDPDHRMGFALEGNRGFCYTRRPDDSARGLSYTRDGEFVVPAL
jgi:hypothetical protein